MRDWKIRENESLDWMVLLVDMHNGIVLKIIFSTATCLYTIVHV